MMAYLFHCITEFFRSKAQPSIYYFCFSFSNQHVFAKLFIVDWKLEDLQTTFHDISECFVQSELKRGEWKSATIKNYLISLSHYLDYVKLAPRKKTQPLAPWKTQLSDTEINKMQRQIQLWNKTLMKRITVETVDRQMADQGELMSWLIGWLVN